MCEFSDIVDVTDQGRLWKFLVGVQGLGDGSPPVGSKGEAEAESLFERCFLSEFGELVCTANLTDYTTYNSQSPQRVTKSVGSKSEQLTKSGEVVNAAWTAYSKKWGVN